MCQFLKNQLVRFRGTVIFRIWWQVLIMGMYSSLVVFLYKLFEVAAQKNENSPPKDLDIFQVLGIVTGLLLVFRTNTAYDRYWEGRKLWSQMVNNIRILTRTIWVMLDDKNDSKILIGKVSILNLLVAFTYATKHYLREEYSNQEEDLKDFIKHMPRLATPSSNQPLSKQEKLSMAPSQAVIKHIRKNMSKETRLMMEREDKKLPEGTRQLRFASLPEFERELPLINSNIPLEISFYVSSFIMSCKDSGLLDNPTCRILDTAVGNLVHCLTGFERIRRTPIPFAYSVHLRHITWLVLMLLPLQWVNKLMWYTVPATVVSSFALLGILGIGNEIENPFGYDLNDLNLDDFCKVVHKEVMAIISQPMKKVDEWLYSENNHPIITDPTLSAAALAKMKYKEVSMILSEGKNYKFFHRTESQSVKSAYSNTNKT